MNQIPCPLSTTAKRYSSIPAIISAKLEINYSQLENLVNMTAVNLKARKIKKGARVAILGVNSPEYCILILAILRMGAVACPINHRLPEKSICKALHELKCDMLVFIGKSKHPFKSRKIRSLLAEKLMPKPTRRPAKLSKPQVTLNSPAAIMFTSGTGASPKAALLSYGNFYYNALGANERIPFSSGQRWLLSLPLYHVGAWGILFRAIISGGTIVIPAKNESIGEATNKYGVTHLSLVPTQLYRWLNESVTKIKGEPPIVLVGGASLSKSILKKCRRAKLNMYRTYGLTEMASQVTTGRSINGLHSGNLLSYRELTISADEEILVRGNTLFVGYWKNNRINLPVDSAGWFHTGDAGEIDARGFLTVRGRKDDMIICGGENIHPEEIEVHLMQVPGIEMALVVGIKDEEFGQIPAAFVKYFSNQSISHKQITAELEKSLPRYKIPKIYLRWPERLAIGAFKLPRSEFQKLAAKKTNRA